MERKDFIKQAMALAGLAFVPAAVVESCTKQNNSGPTNVNFTLDLSAADNAALAVVGGYKVTNSVMVIRTGTSTFEALSAVCTHAGCTLGFDSSSNKIVCPCHGGTFNPATGAVLGGPPKSSLSMYKTSLSGTVLTVTS
jgi:cytochrome b6-f complex iron-sulfur subunit